jgi:hypothetical protein
MPPKSKPEPHNVNSILKKPKSYINRLLINSLKRNSKKKVNIGREDGHSTRPKQGKLYWVNGVRQTHYQRSVHSEEQSEMDEIERSYLHDIARLKVVEETLAKVLDSGEAYLPTGEIAPGYMRLLEEAKLLDETTREDVVLARLNAVLHKHHESEIQDSEFYKAIVSKANKQNSTTTGPYRAEERYLMLLLANKLHINSFPDEDRPAIIAKFKERHPKMDDDIMFNSSQLDELYSKIMRDESSHISYFWNKLKELVGLKGRGGKSKKMLTKKNRRKNRRYSRRRL